jgi:hypothetical protein
MQAGWQEEFLTVETGTALFYLNTESFKPSPSNMVISEPGA